MTTEPDPDRPDSRGGASELERAILGEAPELNALDVADATGVTLEEARRLWRALGFPEHGLENAYTDADTEALSMMISAVRADLIDFDLAVNLTRAVGQTMARLADWEVSTLVSRVDELAADPESDEGRTGSALRLIEQIKDPFEDLLIYVWRRHLAAAVARVEALRSNAEDLNTVQLTVGFADIVSFTALSNRLTEERIGDLVELFESRCADVVTTQGGRVIKSIGDSVLFVSEDPMRAYDIAEGIINVVGRDARMPDIRLGLATGAVVMRLGDVFGPPVNLAARLTAVARRNRIIIDATTAGLLPEDEFETRRLPARPVRGFGLVEPLAVRRT
jgi:adenylate cyclase